MGGAKGTEPWAGGKRAVKVALVADDVDKVYIPRS